VAKPNAPSRKTQAADTRDAILRSAVAVLENRGFPATRTSDVAEHAGVSTGLVLYYFSSREKLLAEALRYSEQAFVDAAAARAKPITDPLARIRLLVELCFEASEQSIMPSSWIIWFDMWQQALRNEGIRNDRELLDRKWRDLIADAIRDGQSKGLFAPVNPDTFARMLSALGDGLAIALLLGDSSLTKRQAIEMCVRLCQHELSPEGTRLAF
jgi:AcrR family transcriptional regulator